MKTPRRGHKEQVKKSRRRPQPKSRPNDDQVTELLKICLQKVCEMQAELARDQEEEEPEVAGYAACAMEALSFLTAEGLPSTHPMVKTLREKLTGTNPP